MKTSSKIVQIITSITISGLMVKDMLEQGKMSYDDLQLMVTALVVFVFFGERQWTTK